MNIVGTFDSLDIFHCAFCKKDTFYTGEITVCGEWGSGRFPCKTWKCPNCKKKDPQPNTHQGMKFTCPDCKKENVQAIEPISVEGNLANYKCDELTCLYCASTFGITRVWTEEALIDGDENIDIDETDTIELEGVVGDTFTLKPHSSVLFRKEPKDE